MPIQNASNSVLVRALNKLKASRISFGSAGNTADDSGVGLPDSQLPLPFELVIQIVSHLNISDILRCRLVCRQLKLIVDTVPELQYDVELAVSSYMDNPVNSTTSITQRLHSLKKTQAFWKRPIFKTGHIIALEPLNYTYHGNVFIMPHRTPALDDARLWNAIDCVALEFDRNSSIMTHEWTLDFDFGAESYAVDPSRNLLVLLHWRPRARHHDNHWIFVIHVVSLQDGQATANGILEVQAPPRDFEECPSLEIQGTMVSIVAGGLHGDVADQNRNLYVTIVNIETGIVHAKLTRCCEHGLEYNSKTFTFASDSAFLLAVKYEGCFAIEVYSIADGDAEKEQGVLIPTHIATYQFPPLQKGFSSAGAWNSFTKAYSGSYARKLDPRPFVTDPRSAVLTINRLYYGAAATDAVRVSCYVQLSTFLSSLELHKRRKDGTGPLLLPWNVWGPASTRCFDDSQSKTVHIVAQAAYGSRVYEDGLILDFNQLEIARDLRTSSARLRAAPKLKALTHSTLGGIARGGGPSGKLEDQTVHGYPGRIVRRPTVIPCGNIFIEDVVSMLPYRETQVAFKEAQPKLVFGGEMWAAGFPRKTTDEPGSTALVYRALVPEP